MAKKADPFEGMDPFEGIDPCEDDYVFIDQLKIKGLTDDDEVLKKHLSQLNPRQKQFVLNYFRTGAPVSAAINAGYAESTATQSHNWVKPYARGAASCQAIWDVVNLIRGKLEENDLTSEQSVLGQLEKLAFSDIRQLYDANNQLKPVRDLSEAAAASLAGLDMSVNKLGDKSSRVKTADKLRALELIAKIKGLFKKDNEQRGVSLDQIYQFLLDNAPAAADAFIATLKARTGHE